MQLQYLENFQGNIFRIDKCEDETLIVNPQSLIADTNEDEYYYNSKISPKIYSAKRKSSSIGRHKYNS